jgi:hypothetical protein
MVRGTAATPHANSDPTLIHTMLNRGKSEKTKKENRSWRNVGSEPKELERDIFIQKGQDALSEIHCPFFRRISALPVT